MIDLPPPGSFVPRFPPDVLDDLKTRLARARWPEDGTSAGWRYGVGRSDLERLAGEWQTYDWSSTQARLAQYEHVRVDCGSHVLHALQARADAPAATVVLIHGWPSSFLEMERLAQHLVLEPQEGLAFDVVVPSLPGFGFSDPLGIPGPSSFENAGLLLDLLANLGVERFWLHAHDIGASTAVRMALLAPDRVLGYHTTEPGIPRADWPEEVLSEEERAHLAFARQWHADEGGYAAIQSTRPLTLAYALTDSPVGMAAWIFEKWRSWTFDGRATWDWEGSLTTLLLETLTLYWATGCIAGANRVYFGADKRGVPFQQTDQISCPVGVALTAQRIEQAPESMARRIFPDIRVWTPLGRGGHFIAGEAPDLLAANIRRFITSAQ